MKQCIIFLLFGLLSFEDSPFYSINVVIPGGRQIQMSEFRGRKVVIAVFNPGNPDRRQMTLLDSIKNAVPSTGVLEIPASDFSGPALDFGLYNLQDSLGRRIVITRSMLVKRSAAGNQHPLFKWLTSVSQNGHFDRDVEQEGQLFFINERGVLYGILTRTATSSDIVYALNQHISQ